ncbi:MAG: L,D-transpeptidase family protein [Veillonellales bacterium]
MKIRKLYLDHPLSQINFSEDKKHPLVPRLQQLLKNRGLYKGVLQAEYDAETREAVALFQESAGLPATGIADPLTYCHLLDSPVSEIPVLKSAERADFSLPRGNILIAKAQRRLTLFDGNNPVHQYPVGIGKPATPTPSGNYAIANKILNPGGMLGTRWMGLNYDTYGIHGTRTPCILKHDK